MLFLRHSVNTHALSFRFTSPLLLIRSVPKIKLLGIAGTVLFMSQRPFPTQGIKANKYLTINIKYHMQDAIICTNGYINN